MPKKKRLVDEGQPPSTKETKIEVDAELWKGKGKGIAWIDRLLHRHRGKSFRRHEVLHFFLALTAGAATVQAPLGQTA